MPANAEAASATSATLTQTLWAHVKSRHRSSNRLVNLKLAVALSSRQVYSQLVRDFYEVFRTFEGIWRNEIDRKDAKPGSDGSFLRDTREALELFGRTKAFERDLRYYLGPEWDKVSKPTESAVAYVQHVREVAKEDPDRMLCYIYAFLSGLMAGGWVLRRKIIRVVWRLPSEVDWDESNGTGTSIFEFTLPGNPRELAEIHLVRTKLKSVLDSVAWREAKPAKIDAMKTELVRVFEWNDRVIRNVPGGVYELLMAWIWWIAGFSGLLIAWVLYRRRPLVAV